MDLAGRPMLEREIERLRRCRRADEIVLAMTTNADDDPLVALADRLGLRWHRGCEHDVLSRYAGAAREADADVVVRVTVGLPADRSGRGRRGDRGARPADSTTPPTCSSARSRAGWTPRRCGATRWSAWTGWRRPPPRASTSPGSATPSARSCSSLRSVRRPFDAADLRWTVDTRGRPRARAAALRRARPGRAPARVPGDPRPRARPPGAGGDQRARRAEAAPRIPACNCPQEFSIGDRMVGPGHPTYVIAEAGANHNRDWDTARRLIDVAAEAGADAVKFQTYSGATVCTRPRPRASSTWRRSPTSRRPSCWRTSRCRANGRPSWTPTPASAGCTSSRRRSTRRPSASSTRSTCPC